MKEAGLAIGFCRPATSEPGARGWVSLLFILAEAWTVGHLSPPVLGSWSVLSPAHRVQRTTRCSPWPLLDTGSPESECPEGRRGSTEGPGLLDSRGPAHRKKGREPQPLVPRTDPDPRPRGEPQPRVPPGRPQPLSPVGPLTSSPEPRVDAQERWGGGAGSAGPVRSPHKRSLFSCVLHLGVLSQLETTPQIGAARGGLVPRATAPPLGGRWERTLGCRGSMGRGAQGGEHAGGGRGCYALRGHAGVGSPSFLQKGTCTGKGPPRVAPPGVWAGAHRSGPLRHHLPGLCTQERQGAGGQGLTWGRGGQGQCLAGPKPLQPCPL